MPSATLIANISSPTPSVTAVFGSALAAVGSTELYVGASGLACVFIYKSSTAGVTWQLAGNLTGPAGSGYGAALALSSDGNTLFVGAPAASSSRGAVYAHPRLTAALPQPAWGLTPTALALPASYSAGQLGTSLAYSGALALLFAGAPGASLVAAFSSPTWALNSSSSVYDPCGQAALIASALAADASANASSSPLFVGNKVWTGVRGMFFAAYPDEGGWAFGKQVQGGSNVGCALALAPGGQQLLHSACGSVSVGVYAPSGAGALALRGFSLLGSLPRSAGVFYSAPAPLDEYGFAIAVAPTGAFTAVSAPSAVSNGRKGAVLVYGSGALTPTPSRTPAPSPSPSPRPSPRSGACGSNATFLYTGSFQYFSVPPGVTWLAVYAWGAGGSGQGGNNGGGGAYISGNLSVAPGDTLRIIVGAGGGAVAEEAALLQVGGGAGFGYPNGGGRSAVQRALRAEDYPQMYSMWGGADRVELGLRGLTGQWFSDVATAAGGGGSGGGRAGSGGAGGSVGLPGTKYSGVYGNALAGPCAA